MSQDATRVTGWWIFAGTLLAIAGILNIIWGIGAIDDAQFLVNDQKFIISNLNTWGWVVLVIGVVQLFAAFSLYSGGGFGRVIGVLAASLAAISALVSIPAAPFWAICIFALSVIVIFELTKPRD